MTTTDPLDRAAKAFNQAYTAAVRSAPSFRAGITREDARKANRAGMRAAFTAGLDRDEIARVLYEHDQAMRDVTHWTPWRDAHQLAVEDYRDRADAVIAHLTGGGDRD